MVWFKDVLFRFWFGIVVTLCIVFPAFAIAQPGAHKSDAELPPFWGNLSVWGSLDPARVEKVFQQHAVQVRRCLKDLKIIKDLSTATISIRINDKGVVYYDAHGPALSNNSDAKFCIANVVKRWRFPKPKDGKLVVISQTFSVIAPDPIKVAEEAERAAQYRAEKAEAEEVKMIRASMNKDESQAEALFVEQAKTEIEAVENNVLMYVSRKELAKQIPCVHKWSDWTALQQDTESRICQVWIDAIAKVPPKIRSLVRRDLIDDFCSRRSPDGRDSFSAGPCGSFEGLVVSERACRGDLVAMCKWPSNREEDPAKAVTLEGDDRDAFDTGFKRVDELLRAAVTAKANGRDARKSAAFQHVLAEVSETWESVCLSVGKKALLAFATAECSERYPVSDVMSCYSNLPSACAYDPCFPDGCNIEVQDCVRLVQGLVACRGR